VLNPKHLGHKMAEIGNNSGIETVAAF